MFLLSPTDFGIRYSQPATEEAFQSPARIRSEGLLEQSNLESRLACKSHNQERTTLASMSCQLMSCSKTNLFSICSQSFVSLSFSHDGKHLLGLGDGPDWTATLWNWEKQKVICAGRVGSTAEARIYEAAVCPFDPHRMCVVGDQCLKFLKNSLADSPTQGVGTWQVLL